MQEIKKTKEEGFTLLELLIYISIFIILIAVITLFSVTLIKSVNKNYIKKEVAGSAYTAMKTMLYEIKMAKDVYAPTSVFNAYPGQLSLETTQDTPDGENTTYVDFYLDNNGKLCVKREGRDTEYLISENLKVSNLDFEYLSSVSKSVRINLTVLYDTSNPEYQYLYTLTSTGTIRR